MSDRMIRSGFWSSPDVATCTPVQRLIYIGLWAYADDFGRGECNLKAIEAAIFPHSQDTMPTLTGDPVATFGGQWRPMAAAFDVLTYEVNGRIYFQIQHWEKHQRLRKGRTSRYPDPASGNPVALDSGGFWRPLAAKSGPEVEVEVEVEVPPTVVGGTKGVARAEATPAPAPSTQLALPNRADTARQKRGTRLQPDWTPDLDLPTNQRLHAQHDPSWLSDQLERFRDYWTARTGKDATKLDWNATWRNWIKRAQDQTGPRQTPENARIQAMYTDAATRQVSIYQQIINNDTRRQAS